MFAGTYAGIDVFRRCIDRTDHGSTTGQHEIDDITITLDHDDTHHVNPPTIGCELTARTEGTRLQFRPQSCASGHDEQSEIQGTAQFDDEGLLELHLTSVEFWPPSPTFWPDGLWWDCRHDYLLDPVE